MLKLFCTVEFSVQMLDIPRKNNVKPHFNVLTTLPVGNESAAAEWTYIKRSCFRQGRATSEDIL